MSEAIDTLNFISGKDEVVATMSKRQDIILLNIEVWKIVGPKLIQTSNSAAIIFDATSSIDPCYLVNGAPK